MLISLGGFAWQCLQDPLTLLALKDHVALVHRAQPSAWDAGGSLSTMVETSERATCERVR